MKRIYMASICCVILAACGDNVSKGNDPELVEGPSSSSKVHEIIIAPPVNNNCSYVPDYTQKVVDPSTVTIGELVDARDGITYKTVSIGTQTWMAENLRNKRGKNLYDWVEAMGCRNISTCKPTYPERGICPKGWHLPTKAEFTTLIRAIGDSAGVKLRSTSGWVGRTDGTDAYAFSALPGCYYSDGYCPGITDSREALFWMSSEYDGNSACLLGIDVDKIGAVFDKTHKYIKLSVRCVKDSLNESVSSSLADTSSTADAVSSSSLADIDSTAESSSSSKKNESSSSVISSSSVAPKSSSSSIRENFSSSRDSEPVKGTLTDSRDTQTYKTVVIGSQTWMAENLNYETENSFCYDNDPANCTTYGRLYTWGTAMDSAGTWTTNGKGCGELKTCSPTYPVRGVCPEGWHLPSKAEFEILIDAVGGSKIAGKMLKSVNGWNSSGNGTDDYAFSVLPAGERVLVYYNQGSFSAFWSSVEKDSLAAFRMSLNDGASAIMFNWPKDSGYSVRCIKD